MVDVSAKKFVHTGDTITVRIKNLTSANHGFYIEAVSLGKSLECETAVYSAFFNADNSFFQKLKMAQALSKSENIGYIMPDYELHPYEVEGNDEKLLSFVIKGKALQNGVRLKLRITTDIIKDRFETVYSAPLTVLSMPN